MSYDAAKSSNYVGQVEGDKLRDHLTSVDKDLGSLYRVASVFHQFGTGNNYSVLTYTSSNYQWFSTIGSWNITGTLLFAGAGATYMGLQPGVGIWMGDAAFASAVFSVDPTGVMKAESGKIGGWFIGATTLSSTNLVFDSTNELIRTQNFVSGPLGTGWQIDPQVAEFQNARIRGKVTNASFETDVISSVGGNLLVAESDILTADMTALDASTMTISSDTTFAVNDILRIKDGVDDEWMQVASVSHTTYTLTRDKAGDYAADGNPIWKAGTAVVSYGATDEGIIFMTASESNAPHIDVITHSGSPWATTTTRMRMGNLNGFLGYSSDRYGIAIGESTNFMKYDPVDGLEVRGNITTSSLTACTISASSINTSSLTSISIDSSVISASTINTSVINTSTLSSCTISTSNILISNGGFARSGQTDYNVGTGFWIGDDGGTPKMSIGNSSTAQTFTWDGNNLEVANIQSPDYVPSATGYKLHATEGLEVNTGSIAGAAIESLGITEGGFFSDSRQVTNTSELDIASTTYFATGKRLVVWSTVDTFDAGDTYVLRLYIDGVKNKELSVLDAKGTVTMMGAQSVSAGNLVIKVTGEKSTGGPASASIADVAYVEFKNEP